MLLPNACITDLDSLPSFAEECSFGTDRQIHAVKEMLVIALPLPSLQKAYAVRFLSVPASHDQPYNATSAQLL